MIFSCRKRIFKHFLFNYKEILLSSTYKVNAKWSNFDVSYKLLMPFVSGFLVNHERMCYTLGLYHTTVLKHQRDLLIHVNSQYLNYCERSIQNIDSPLGMYLPGHLCDHVPISDLWGNARHQQQPARLFIARTTGSLRSGGWWLNVYGSHSYAPHHHLHMRCQPHRSPPSRVPTANRPPSQQLSSVLHADICSGISNH